MRRPKLKTCPYLGPIDPDPGRRSPKRRLSADHASQPLKYLPPRISLSASELELASQYEAGDFSGGYITSQIAFFRRGPTAPRHRERRNKFRRLKKKVDRYGLVLPDAFIELVESDDAIARLRHDTIWLTLPDELAPLPSNPADKLFLIFREAQGGGYWHLLLLPHGGHVVTYSEHPFGLRRVFLKGYEPDPASVEVYQCAKSFSQWIVNYFMECVKVDRKYANILRKYPGV
jgi:hypothetical protein